MKEFTIKQPKNSDATVLAHQAKETQRKRHGERVQKARKSKLAKLANTMKLRDPEDAKRAADAAIAHAELENEIETAQDEIDEDLPVKAQDEDARKLHDGAWKSHNNRNDALKKHRGNAFAIIKGQCDPNLIDGMKQDETWEGIIEGKDPKKPLELIHAVVHAQTSDQYPCATVCDHESKLYSLQQNVLTNAEHYEKFNTKVNVGLAVGVEHKHPALLKLSLIHI